MMLTFLSILGSGMLIVRWFIEDKQDSVDMSKAAIDFNREQTQVMENYSALVKIRKEQIEELKRKYSQKS